MNIAAEICFIQEAITDTILIFIWRSSISNSTANLTTFIL